jgi:hypothetical protein
MKSRLLLAATAAALAVSGCGSTHTATTTAHDPTFRELEAQGRAQLKRIEATERAEGKDPAKTRAHREAEEARELNASLRKQKTAEARVEAGKEAQETEQRKTEAEIRAHDVARESAPASHRYPATVRTGFLRGCDASTGHEDSACRCALKRIEARVPLGHYRENESEIEAGRPLPLTYSVQYGYCVGSAG